MSRYGDYHAGNRDREQWNGPGRGWGAAPQPEEARGPTALEIALVRKLGGKVKLVAGDFHNVREFVVVRTEDKTDDSVTLEVRDKRDARNMTIELRRQPNGSFGEDRYGGL